MIFFKTLQHIIKSIVTLMRINSLLKEYFNIDIVKLIEELLEKL